LVVAQFSYSEVTDRRSHYYYLLLCRYDCTDLHLSAVVFDVLHENNAYYLFDYLILLARSDCLDYLKNFPLLQLLFDLNCDDALSLIMCQYLDVEK
jgi:hypothetical protein